MNKFAALLAAGMLLSGCVYNSKVSTGAEQLQHHRFVLTSVNGQAVNASDRPLELSFGEKMAITGKMYVSGNMCNGFSGEGKVSDGELKVKSLAMTRMLCHDAQLNTLDATIDKMLREGAHLLVETAFRLQQSCFQHRYQALEQSIHALADNRCILFPQYLVLAH